MAVMLHELYLLRGLGRESGHWQPFVQKIKQQGWQGPIHCLDLPGAGRFFEITAPLTISETAAFLRTQITSPSSNKVLVSISLGSMTAVEMACQAPDLFQKIYLINSSFSGLSPVYHRLQLQAWGHLLKIAKSGDIEQREIEIFKMVSQKPEYWPELLPLYTRLANEHPLNPWNFMRQLIAAARYRLPSRPLGDFVALNSLGDQMVHPSCSQKLAEAWDIPLYTHPQAGHDLTVDDPDWIIQKLMD